MRTNHILNYKNKDYRWRIYGKGWNRYIEIVVEPNVKSIIRDLKNRDRVKITLVKELIDNYEQTKSRGK